VNVDAILLAAFAAAGRGGPGRRARRAFDLGAGVGAVGLSLLHLGAVDHVTMVEVDGAMARLAVRNAATNGWTARVSVTCADVRDAGPPGGADLVVCNPPYVPPGRGRAPSAARARARSGAVEMFLDAARRLAGRRARVCIVYPAIETTSLLAALRVRGLEPKRLRAVHGRPEAAARVVLVEAAPGKPGGLAIAPPIVETDARGARSDELALLLAR
jgi:tRNA1Val (adenine37-N6)-methyltransferase